MADGSENRGLFVPTTYSWDISRLEQIENLDPQLKQLLSRLYENINQISLTLNKKMSGVYDNTQEFVTGNTFFPNPAFSSITANIASPRQEFRSVINFGALPNAVTKSFAHNLILNSSWRFTNIYASATDTTNLIGIPIPYVSNGGLVGAGPVEIWVDSINININTTVNMTNFDQCIVVIEYLKY